MALGTAHCLAQLEMARQVAWPDDNELIRIVGERGENHHSLHIFPQRIHTVLARRKYKYSLCFFLELDRFPGLFFIDQPDPNVIGFQTFPENARSSIQFPHQI